MKPDFSLVIPCYNEDRLLRQSVAELFEALDASRFTYEVIFVDDCSRDGTRAIIDEIISLNPGKPIRKIFHARNTGRGGAVCDGIRIAAAEYVGFIDIDLEVHARYIPSFIIALKKGYDVVIAHRIYTFQPRFLIRYVMSKAYIHLVRAALGLCFNDTEAGFKFFNRARILPVIDRTKDRGWFWDTEIVARSHAAGLRVTDIPCLFLKNIHKVSTVSNLRDSLYYLRSLFRFKGALMKERRDRDISEYWSCSPDTFFNQYDNARNPFVKRFLQNRVKKIIPLLRVAPGDKALDVGCGGGIYSRLLMAKRARVTAADYSSAMVRSCAAFLSPSGGSYSGIVRCRAESLGFRTGAYDFLTAIGLLDYVDEPGAVLSEFNRVLKRGAAMVFTIPKRFSPFFFLRTNNGRAVRSGVLGLAPIKTCVSRKDIIRLLAGAGFVLDAMDSYWMTMWVVQCHKEGL